LGRVQGATRFAGPGESARSPSISSAI
jgi:hypothetical protein